MRPELGEFRFDLCAPAARTPNAQLASQLRKLPLAALPLQTGCEQGGWADLNGVQLALVRAGPDHDGLEVTAIAYFEELVGGCNCSDDPVRYPATLRLQLSIAADGIVTAVEPMPE